MSSGHGKRSKVHEEEHEEEGGSERWLVTYADMLTLLMVLFIVLFASSNIDKKKYAGLQKSLSKAFNDGSPATSGGAGILSGGTTQSNQNGKLAGNPSGPGTTAGTTSVDPELGDISQAVQKALASKGLSGKVSQTRDANGLTLTIVTDHVLFDSGSATLLPEGVKIINAIAPALRSTAGRGISVNGYTDSQPIHGAIANNLTLSSDRAVTVADQLISNGVSESTMQTQGYGATKPIADNSTEAGRDKNRRVVIVVSPAAGTTGAPTTTTTTTTASTPAAATTSGATKTTAQVAPASPSAVKLAKGGALAGFVSSGVVTISGGSDSPSSIAIPSSPASPTAGGTR